MAILTVAQVLEIRRRFIPRVVTCRQLANEFGISAGTVSAIVKRKIWKHC